MRYLLDSNMFIAWFARRNGQVIDRLTRYRGTFGISSIVLLELYFGAFNSGKVIENLSKLDALDLPVVHFDESDARAAGEIRAYLKTAGNPIGPYDLLLAGQALARGLVMVTANVREFARVEGLAVENWLAD